MTITTTPVRTTRAPLTAGILAGPLFVGASLVQAFTRDGFDVGRHPISLLARGDLGWIQIANFVLTGSLYVVCAAGLHQVVPSVWGPRLVALVGLGLVIAGVFVTDAGAGFPPGAPEGAPSMSWHGVLHELGFTVAIVAWTACCFVFRRRFAASGERRWARICIAAPVAVLLVIGWPDLDSLSVRLVVATAIQFGFFAALCIRLGRAA
jgi:hypothetical protein